MLSLYQKIDVLRLQCLNEAEEGSGKMVFKPWDERLDKSKVRHTAVNIIINGLFNHQFPAMSVHSAAMLSYSIRRKLLS